MERPQDQQPTVPKFSFRNALVDVPVPSVLREGVHVLRVQVDGSMRKSFLTLSEDKFTLYVTSSKVKLGGSSGGFLPFRGRKKSDAKADAEDDYVERSIDISAIDRIQRGQVTHKFELAKKSHRQGSKRNLLADQRTNSQKNLQSPDEDVDEGEGINISLAPKRSFSIIFRGARTLDLMMDDKTVDRDEVLNALDSVIRAYKAAKVKVANEVLLLRYIWLDLDKDKTGTLNVASMMKMLNRINYQIKKKDLQQQYTKFTSILALTRQQKRSGLQFEHCCTFLHKIKRDSWEVKPVTVLWNEMFGALMNNGKPRENVSDRTFLEKFCHKKQGETHMTLDQVQRLFKRLQKLEIAHTVEKSKSPTRIDRDRFEQYLLSKENDAFDPIKERFDSRLMTHPISEYWINSSHNTYLTGDQFTSHSSVEMYMNSLYRGCRCLELDIWDSETRDLDGKPVPVVWHGHTMTTKILFKDIIKCLKVFLNFHPDTYPLVLSFENHCSVPFQEVMAEDLVEILGESLYIPTEESLLGLLPSPQDLRGMVVIKGRRPDYSLGGDDDTDDDSDDEDDTAVTNDRVSTTSASETNATHSTGDKTKSTSGTTPTNHKISPALARLTLFHGCKMKKKNWDISVRNPTHHMHSFSENKVKGLCRQGRSRKWLVYNQSHMTRTYPAGSRVDSSNYSPMLAWSVGCQMVALNFQTSDAPLQLNDGRFRENGACGYVLKPSSLMIKSDYAGSDPLTKLKIRVLCGSCLPKPKGQRSGECIAPFVRVSVYDVNSEAKETCVSYSTEVRQHNGFFPIWKGEEYSFTIENVAVAMLHLAVYDKGDVGSKDEFIASASIPITCLRQGIRSVQLVDSNNTRSGVFDFASLLIVVRKFQSVAEI